MKKIYLFLTALAMMGYQNGNAIVHTVTVTNNQFSPMAITDVNVGDVIHWVEEEGSHTTTSTSVPAGADTWDNTLNTTFDYTVEVPGLYVYICQFHNGMGGGFQVLTPTSVEPVLSGNSDMNVGVNYNTHAIFVRVSNANSAHMTLKMIDITGKQVAEIFEGELGAGEKVFDFDASAQTAGLYFIRMEQNGKVITRKVMIN